GVDLMIVGRGGGSIEDLWAFNEELVARAIFDCGVPIISAVGHEIDWTIADYVSDLRAPTPSAAAELAVFDYALTKQKLIEHKLRMNRSMSRCISMMRQRLEHEKTKLRLLSPQNRLNENRRRLLDYEEKIADRMQKTWTKKKHELMLLANTLEGLSPVKKISSGYAYVETEGKSIKSIQNVNVSDEILVHVTDGQMKAVVTEVVENE
ncbi:MAG: exodeoxyribonuclease VII large subunit, partial [Agathobacter sp.]|nr:exodeoxyribonuclease VII large subunit [Agathobacter sp.]